MTVLTYISYIKNIYNFYIFSIFYNKKKKYKEKKKICIIVFIGNFYKIIKKKLGKNNLPIDNIKQETF